jgi:hypothetical protein
MIEKDGSDFVRIYNDLEKYPALADVALALDISIKTVRNKAGFIRSLSKARYSWQCERQPHVRKCREISS